MEEDDNLLQSFKIINIIYMALGAGMITSSVIFMFLVQSGNAAMNPGLTDILKIVVPVIAVVGFAAGRFLYTTSGKKSKEETNQSVKINNYRTACLIVWATIEGPGLFSSIAYFITGNQLFLIFFGMIFMGYLFSKPAITKFQQDF